MLVEPSHEIDDFVFIDVGVYLRADVVGCHCSTPVVVPRVRGIVPHVGGAVGVVWLYEVVGRSGDFRFLGCARNDRGGGGSRGFLLLVHVGHVCGGAGDNAGAIDDLWISTE